ncbi:MAG TPA: hypothetical protein DEA22_03450 [Blastocatellia bacterium]|nr:hypothetical protein [Blastocatellia bacterium]
MYKLRVILADDERPAREYLKNLLAEINGVEIVGEAVTGADAVELIKSAKPDLAILDLQMPELSGLEAVKMLRKNQMPLVAFVTAYDQFAVQAFELNAIDYLLKPVERQRLKQTIARSLERIEHLDWRETEAKRIRNAIKSYENAEKLERIPVKLRDEIILVPVAEIASVIADGELLRITTGENQKYVINFRLKDLEPKLDEKRFVRLSRGAIVNIDAIASLAPMPGGTFIVFLTNGQELPTSRLQSRILRSRLLRL